MSRSVKITYILYFNSPLSILYTCTTIKLMVAKLSLHRNFMMFIFVPTTYSNYDNPCEFLSAFQTSGTCPPQLEAHGLPCTCPFNPENINLPPSVFQAKLNTAWEWIVTVSSNVLKKHVQLSKALYL